MAQQRVSPSQHSLWRRARGVPLLIVLAAAFKEAGINSAVAATAVTLAVPVTATVFIYEVSVLRGAQLDREAIDRVRRDVAFAAPRSQPAAEENVTTSVTASVASPTDVAARLDAMLASRSALLDTFGDDASTVAPIYARIIKQMLKDDDVTLASLKAKREADSQAGAAPMDAREASLRTVHDRLARLVDAARPATSAAQYPPKMQPGG